eukprot:TRINITY_DN4764_c0_g1_i1.p1 TRINITY_DN4764_c0_g1~~TRINITY_DN4764_c0_g1_i1.p1  ORF type:complete len:563 (+),score=112.50 TRINITY_DN4764_c0_g1_i1:96-1784(+)
MEDGYEFQEMDEVGEDPAALAQSTTTVGDDEITEGDNGRKKAVVIMGVVFSILLMVSAIVVIAVGRQTDRHVFINIDGLGRVKGLELPTADTYLGIPYAKPPLRWEKPQPITKWDDIQDATSIKPNCVNADGEGSEDCLYLNIFTPHNSKHMQALPVLIWLHGGCFSFGGPTDYKEGSLIVNEHNVIVVVPAFRIGMLGFLYSKSSNITGDYGFYDQQMAMQFIKQHISNFGGDPNKVTLYGQSSGAGDVSLHYLNEESRKLFRSGIAVSAAFPPWGTVPLVNAENQFKNILELNNCDDVDCLKKMTISELFSQSDSIFGECLDGCTYAPATESNILDMVRTTNISNDIPLLIGQCSDDGAGYTPLSQLPDSATATEVDLGEFVQNRFPNTSAEFVSSLLSLPFDSTPRINCTEFCSIANNIETDFAYTCPASMAIQSLASRDVTVWRLKFTKNPRPSKIPFTPHSCMQPYFWDYPESSENSWKMRIKNNEHDDIGKSLRELMAKFIKEPHSSPASGWNPSTTATVSDTFFFPDMKMVSEKNASCEFFNQHADYFTTCMPGG